MEPRQVVLDFFAAAARRDKEATKEFLAPDVSWNDNGPPEMIGGGNFRNANEVIDYICAHFINYFDSMPLLRATCDVEFKKPGAARKGGR